MNFTLKIWRQKDAKTKGGFETYKVENISADTSFLEMLDILNNNLIHEGKEPVAFDHDCREGICGMCSLHIDGHAHGPGQAATTCQIYMRKFKDGATITIEPWRSAAFPVIKDLVVNRSAYDQILQAGGFISVRTNSVPDANAIPIAQADAEESMDAAACIGCGACVRACEKGATRVLKLNEDTGKIEKDTCCCVGCGECVRACPASAWTRQETKFYRVILGGRTGRQTPRTGKMFLNWATEDVVLSVLGNWQKFSAWVMNYKPEYLHGGHLIDRAGYKKFKELMLDGVTLNPECLVAEDIFWQETEYRSNFNVKPLSMHHTAGPQE